MISSFALARTLARHPAETWPSLAAPLHARAAMFSAGFTPKRVLVDAGHGAPGNSGNRSAFCVDEQDFTSSLAEDLSRALEATGHFETKQSRYGKDLVPYAERIRLAESWGADVILSLHSDVRGRAEPWQPRANASCLHDHDAPGFSVLFSDQGEGELASHRRQLGRALAGELESAGFLAYDGTEYQTDYAGDDVRGVFVDRHRESERIFVLWRPRIPSVIIETHNALDEREAMRWNEPATRAEFAKAVAAALASSF